MINALIGKKISMSMRFNQAGEQVPVTALLVGPCLVTQVRTAAKDGYWGVQLGFGGQKLSRINKPIQGFFKKAGLKKNPRFLRPTSGKSDAGNHELAVPRVLGEVRLIDRPAESDLPQVGTVIQVDQVFKPGDRVRVSGTSKGRGFAGVMKRWGFSGGPRTHGQSDRQRAPGSISQTTDPGRVWPGKKMAGHFGNELVTVKNLIVQDVDATANLLLVKGSVPGSRRSLVVVSKVGHDGKFTPLVASGDDQKKIKDKEG